MGGKNVIVEIDEALLGKRKTMKHGNYPEILKFWVLGITERKPANKKNSKYVIVPNRSKNTLEKIIKDSVDKALFVPMNDQVTKDEKIYIENTVQ